MKRLLVSVLVLAGFLAVDAVGIWAMTPGAKSPVDALHKRIPEAAAFILVKTMRHKITFPQQINDITQLSGVEAYHNQVIYELRLDVDNNQFLQVAKNLKEKLMATACQQENYRQMLSYGLSIVYSARSVNGMQAEPIIFTSQSCGVKEVF